MAAKGPSESPAPWQVLESRHIFTDRWIRLRSDTVRQPDGRVLPPSHVFEYPDWVDVIALTDTFNVVLVDQYRHAVGEVRTEFPAGMVDDDSEEPLAAIKRELLEETGYASADWRLIGSAPVNPALQTNRIHSFLALGARRIAEQDLDTGEAIRTHELPLPAFIEQVEAGRIELPALQLASLHWLLTYLRRSSDPRLAPLLSSRAE
jgi:8-oxo-dGTP pyrophosphatase MutT (NUDIX family)